MMSNKGSDPVIVVSGPPRSGTSMMMRMLDAGGIPVIADHQRQSDIDNPNGYYEFEPVKNMKEDVSWLETAGGSVVKAIYLLLYDLPPIYDYQVIFMDRELDEVLSSQELMLERLGTAPEHMPSQAEFKQLFTIHLAKMRKWLQQQDNFSVLELRYDQVVADPFVAATRIAAFLGRDLDVNEMAAAVDPDLYRNRVTG